MNHEFWYFSRAAGFTAFGLLFISVSLGIMVGTRLTGRFSRNTIFDIHRFTSILALAFTLFHVYILLGDSYFKFNIWQLSLPFASPYQAWQTAVGVFSAYILVLVIASFYVRQFIGYRAWRAVHFLTFALFGLAMLHGITAGTDTDSAWARTIYMVAGATTLVLVLYRAQYHLPAAGASRRIRYAAGAISTAGIAALLFGTGLLSSSGGGASTTRSSAAPNILDQRAALLEALADAHSKSSDDNERHVRYEGDDEREHEDGDGEQGGDDD